MAKILVVGESCTDIFVYCEALKLAPDIPVPVLQVLERVENPGMAANVFRNIKAYVNDSKLMTNENAAFVTKTRFVHQDSNHMFFRVDTPHDIERIKIESINLDYDIVVISDYNRGFLSNSDIEFICRNHDNVFLDTKKIIGDWARHAKYIKINDFEYRNSESLIDEELKAKIIRTLGHLGCEFQGNRFPVESTEIRDTSGAGDSFLAALVVEFSVSGDILKSIKFANLKASEVVKHRGVTTI